MNWNSVGMLALCAAAAAGTDLRLAASSRFHSGTLGSQGLSSAAPSRAGTPLDARRAMSSRFHVGTGGAVPSDGLSLRAGSAAALHAAGATAPCADECKCGSVAERAKWAG